MTGEVRNASYPPGLFRNFINFSQRLYGVAYGNAPTMPFMRQFDIPASASTKYLSHVTFRVMHAGPVIMTLILLRNYCSAAGWLHFRNPFLATYLTVFTAASLFVIQKLLLSVVEAVLSVMVFGPECFVGMRRMCLAYW